MSKIRCAPLYAWILLVGSAPMIEAQDAIQDALQEIREIGREGRGFDLAIPAAARLRQANADQMGRILDALDGANPVSANWLRGIVFDIARVKTLSLEQLSDYAMDRSNNPDGRGLAMELVKTLDADRAEQLIAQCMEDPSLPLREMAVEQAINRAKATMTEDRAAGIEQYYAALESARHPRQLSRIQTALSELGESVSTADAFSMITQWHSLAPFDNVDLVGFARVYEPESEFVDTGDVNLDATYDGKHGSVKWRLVEGSAEEGKVDLHKAYNQEKGAICYLMTEFESSKARPAQLRLTCVNGNKAWVNGQEVLANEIYHSGVLLDQYIGDCELRAGTNRILLKICQNEMTEDWAQIWAFQCRVTDPTGKALSSGD